MSEDACNGTHGPGQLETVSDITITTACSNDGPASSRNGGTNIPAMSTPNTAIGSSHANSDLVANSTLIWLLLQAYRIVDFHSMYRFYYLPPRICQICGLFYGIL